MTCISWHPSKRVLAVGWENGELFLYSEQNNTCVEVIEASEASFLEDPPEGSNNPPRGYCDSRVEPGGNPTDIWRQCRQSKKRSESKKMIQSSTGSVVGWSLDRSSQLNTVFHHELKDPLVQVVSCFFFMGLPSLAGC